MIGKEQEEEWQMPARERERTKFSSERLKIGKNYDGKKVGVRKR